MIELSSQVTGIDHKGKHDQNNYPFYTKVLYNYPRKIEIITLNTFMTRSSPQDPSRSSKGHLKDTRFCTISNLIHDLFCNLYLLLYLGSVITGFQSCLSCDPFKWHTQQRQLRKLITKSTKVENAVHWADKYTKYTSKADTVLWIAKNTYNFQTSWDTFVCLKDTSVISLGMRALQKFCRTNTLYREIIGRSYTDSNS